MKTLIALVGLPGSGKSQAASFFRERGFTILRFGDQTDIGVQELGLPLTEENERAYREDIRRLLGMAAMAIKIEPRIKETLKSTDTIMLDGMRSNEEYEYLKKIFPRLSVLSITASADIRYARLAKRPIRPLTREESSERDKAEIINLNVTGPIENADYTIRNEGTMKEFQKQLEDFEKILAMQEGGEVLSTILSELLAFSQPGISLLDIETLAMKRIREVGMKPSFPTVANYQWATCLCVNEVIVHGIPTPYKLKAGDLLTTDIGLIHKGYHVDAAWSMYIDGKDDDFLVVGQRALKEAITQAKAGNRVGHISKAIQDVVEGAGFGVVKSLVGHGVGTILHEPPQIPGILRGSVEKTPLLIPGMTLAIEVIYAKGKPEVVYYDDDWSIATRDRSLSAVFEQTIAVTEGVPHILTPLPR